MTDEMLDGEATALLIRARRLIQRGWCKRVAAKGSDGRPVNCNSPKAAEFCALGAMDRALSEWRCNQSMPIWPLVYSRARSRLNAAVPPLYARYPPAYNDAKETEVEDVLAMFDRAIGGK